MVQVEVDTPSGDGRVSLHVRGGGGINNPGKIVAVLLAAVESLTGMSCDAYAEQINFAGREGEG